MKKVVFKSLLSLKGEMDEDEFDDKLQECFETAELI